MNPYIRAGALGAGGGGLSALIEKLVEPMNYPRQEMFKFFGAPSGTGKELVRNFFGWAAPGDTGLVPGQTPSGYRPGAMTGIPGEGGFASAEQMPMPSEEVPYEGNPWENLLGGIADVVLDPMNLAFGAGSLLSGIGKARNVARAAKRAANFTDVAPMMSPGRMTPLREALQFHGGTLPAIAESEAAAPFARIGQELESLGSAPIPQSRLERLLPAAENRTPTIGLPAWRERAQDMRLQNDIGQALGSPEAAMQQSLFEEMLSPQGLAPQTMMMPKSNALMDALGRLHGPDMMRSIAQLRGDKMILRPGIR